MNDDNKTEVNVVLVNGETISEKLFNEVKKQVARTASMLEPDTIRILERLVDKEFWSSLTPQEHKEAGKCMAALAKQQLVPYVEAGKRSDNIHQYRVIK